MAEVDSNQKAHPDELNHVFEVGATTTEYKRHPAYSHREWLLESISSILALGVLIGIALIFWYMDNKPLSAWRGRVSLNATISILTTAYTTALMHGVSTFIAQSKWLHFRNGPRKLADLEKFDGASRGVGGSILLLTTVKWNLATIGAFITILRLAFSPFAQQVVLIEQRDIISSANTVTFGYAHNYTRSILNIDTFNSDIESTPQDPHMQSTIIQGIYGINTAEPFHCPGACRWTESYISLGFKSECRNVTQETLQTATCEGSEYSSQQCNMTTPGGIDLATRFWFSDLGTTYYLNASSLLVNTSISSISSSNAFPDTFPEITRFAIYRSTPDSNFLMHDINITDCSLFITAYEYTGAKANGSDFSFASRREVDFGVKNPWTIETGTKDIKFKRIYTNQSTSSDIHIPALEMGYSSLTAVETFFESTSIVTEWVSGNFINPNLGVAAALSGDVDISARFHKMAIAMTDYLRYGPNTQSAYGEVVQSEPFVSIRWGYFIVPIVTEVFAILFAILSIFSNRESRRVPLWKSSTLAVLACQYEERLGLLETTGRDINEIQDEAEKAEVQLQ
ncbi:uncharacterized protein N7479_003074 [Penicillium vulpinum]|uniref:Uncharacterized protein n=1 Tax=Penicillium vulpinum TaxID=29845 RepID=A0A1V6S3H1_9EURO|nr:uncharacterized protein N7479_003074 [Penicillium vulpinum]KAJ5963198.1 hypothetical protein N7479_003074 [Penicillium vulpinum]OQE08591.1 hypothetical protein PENVUL_c009G05548 [Penicillium vulpinum]